MEGEEEGEVVVVEVVVVVKALVEEGQAQFLLGEARGPLQTLPLVVVLSLPFLKDNCSAVGRKVVEQEMKYLVASMYVIVSVSTGLKLGRHF